MTQEQLYKDWTALMPKGVRACFYEVCDSTNSVAIDIASRFPDEKAMWVIAGSQSAGRGRRGREWVSEEGNFYGSFLWRPALNLNELAALPYIVALVVRDTLISLGVNSDQVQCKWPNDVLATGKKVSGILIETSAKDTEQLDYVVIGIGINLMHFPSDAAFAANSLIELLGQKVPVEIVASELAENMRKWLNAFDPCNPAAIYHEWTANSWGLGEEREIRTANDTFIGKLIKLADDGGLEIKKSDGTYDKVYAGDIFPANNTPHTYSE